MQSCRRGIRKRGRPRGRPSKKAPIPTQQTASSTSDSEISDPNAHVTTDQESSAPPVNLRYGLRRNRSHVIVVEPAGYVIVLATF